MRRLATRLAVLALLAGGLASGGQWVPAALGQAAPPRDGLRWITHGPAGGSVAALAVNPGNPQVVYAGTLPSFGSGGSGHVYRTVNGARTWQRSALKLPAGVGVSALVIDALDGSVVYAATTGAGVFRSDDRGWTWAPSNRGLPVDASVTDLAAEPSHPRVLYATAHDPHTFAGDVFATRDGGDTWHGTGLGFDPGPLAISRADPGLLFAGANRSSDHGRHWKAMTFDDSCGCGAATGLAPDPTNASIVYAGLAQALIARGSVQASTDGGVTWTEVLSTNPVESIVMDPADPMTVYAGTGQFEPGKVVKTTDGGTHWSNASKGLPAGEVLALASDPLTPDVLYAGSTSDGASKSIDGGGTWSPASRGLGEASVDVLGASQRSSAGLYAGTPMFVVSGGAVYHSADQGRTWGPPPPAGAGLTFNGRVQAIAVHPTNPNVVYVGVTAYCDACDRGAIDRSVDGGRTWTDVSIPNPFHHQGVTDLAIDPRHPLTLYEADFLLGGVFKTTDGGRTWFRVGIGLADVTVLRLAVSPTADNVLYAGACASCAGQPGGVYRSADGGRTWIAANQGQESDDVNDVVIDASDPHTLYAAVRDASNGANGVQRSTDGGRTWTDVSSGLPGGVAIKALAVDPADPLTVYAGTDGAGVFVSADGGGSWSAQNAGLTDLKVTSLAVAPDGSTVYAGTSSSGVFGLQVR